MQRGVWSIFYPAKPWGRLILESMGNVLVEACGHERARWKSDFESFHCAS